MHKFHYLNVCINIFLPAPHICEHSFNDLSVCVSVRALLLMYPCFATNRKLLQEANLDAKKLLAFLDDTSLLNSVLLDAGIDIPGDRLDIILAMKTMKTRNASLREFPTGSARGYSTPPGGLGEGRAAPVQPNIPSSIYILLLCLLPFLVLLMCSLPCFLTDSLADSTNPR